MKLLRSSGQKAARTILSLFIIILPFWNLAGGSVSTVNQQEQATETASLDVTETAQPSETPSLTATETIALPFESLTATFPPPTLTETLGADLLVSDQSLSGEFATGEVLLRFRKRASREILDGCIQ